MAANHSKYLFFKILPKNNQINDLRLLGPHLQCYSSSSNFSDYGPTRQKISKAMQAYLDKAKSHDKFINEQLEEFNIGKKYLAKMMGTHPNEMSQAKINEAIDYLFPSGLFVPKSRPMMKPPSEVYKERKAALFDYTGRPYHFLFYTAKQNFSQVLHDAANHLEELNLYEQKMSKMGVLPEQKLALLGGEWISLEELENKMLEKIYKVEYDKFIEVFERLSAHPYAYKIESFIKTYWKNFKTEFKTETVEPEIQKDGSLSVTIPRATRKSSFACVKVTYPGQGRICVNGIGIDYFLNLSCREQNFGGELFEWNLIANVERI